LECGAIKHELKACACIPEKTDVVLTGRYVPTLLVDRADLVNAVKDSKHLDEMVTLEGIKY
jgi:ATP:corrinoid adenosyltransferase